MKDDKTKSKKITRFIFTEREKATIQMLYDAGMSAENLSTLYSTSEDTIHEITITEEIAYD